MKVGIIVGGDGRTSHCGVRDYSLSLAEALGELGVQAEVLTSPTWHLKGFRAFCENLRSRNFDVVHIQYPSSGFKWSLAPHLMGLMKTGKKTLVTLHEYSELPAVQRLSTLLFRWTADRILFTTEFEKQKFPPSFGPPLKGYPPIPIGSNIPRHPFVIKRENRIIYFGQIKPGKGVEAFLELAQGSIDQNSPCRFLVIGSVPDRHAEYFKAIRARSPPGVEWALNLPASRIAEILAGSLAAYLPFPDGASYRRGSMLAAIVNGLPVIASIGPATPEDLAKVLLCARDAVQAGAHLERLLNSLEAREMIGRQVRKFANRFCWAKIARKHKMIYTNDFSFASVKRLLPPSLYNSCDHDPQSKSDRRGKC